MLCNFFEISVCIDIDERHVLCAIIIIIIYITLNTLKPLQKVQSINLALPEGQLSLHLFILLFELHVIGFQGN